MVTLLSGIVKSLLRRPGLYPVIHDCARHYVVSPVKLWRGVVAKPSYRSKTVLCNEPDFTGKARILLPPRVKATEVLLMALKPYIRIRPYITGADTKTVFTAADGTLIEGRSIAKEPYTNRLIGFYNPEWRSQVKSHSQAGTDCDGSRVWTPNTLGVKSKAGPITSFVIIGDYTRVRSLTPDYTYPSGYFNPGFDNALLNAALGKFYAKAYEALSPVSGGIVLGELSKTLKLLRNPIAGITRLLEAYRASAKKLKKAQGTRPPSQRLSDALANSWLEFSYGAVPLVSDIGDVCELLSNPAVGRESRIITAKSESVTYGSYLHINSVGAVGYSITSDITRVQTARVKGEIMLDANNGNPHPPVARQWGLDVMNYAPTVYNLIPHSFLADYISNLGQVITAYSVPRSSISWSITTQRFAIHTRTNTTWGGGFLNPTAGPFPSELRAIAFRRRAYSTFPPLPSLAFTGGATAWKALNVLSLAVSRTRSFGSL